MDLSLSRKVSRSVWLWGEGEGEGEGDRAVHFFSISYIRRI